MKRVDILVPVFNSLDLVRECINNVLLFTDRDTYDLWLLDDSSDQRTYNYLSAIEHEHDHITVIRQANNVGFVKNCNDGFTKTQSEWVVLLNSDVLVTEGWLENMLLCGDSDPNIASVNPLTNRASQIDVPMAPGSSYLATNEFFSTYRPDNKYYPDIVTGVGFCLMLRRNIISQLGLFDEIYGRGYCEESDLCMRLTTNGYRTVVTPNAYVYHKKGGTFTDRDERYLNNRKIFDRRWGDEYKNQFKKFHSENRLQIYRDLMEPEKRWDPLTGARFAYRDVRGQLYQKNYLNAFKSILKGAYKTLIYLSPKYNDEILKNYKSKTGLSVTYVLHNLTVAGGVLSVIQLVNRLIQQGVDARLVALREYPEINDWQLLTRPIIYSSPSDLTKNIPESDVVVATHWTTAPWVKKIVDSGRAKKSVYFLQDYEPWFFEENDLKNIRSVKHTYEMIHYKIVKSDWLGGMLLTDGYKSKKIRLGMNLDIFYPRKVVRGDLTIRILAMARPRTPRRGYEDLVSALNDVWIEFGSKIEIIFFGSEKLPDDQKFPHTNAGVISNQNVLAELYSGCDIFIDSSVFQGFGRTALEAMACGTACVVTNVGGVNEYAKHGINCLAVKPSSPADIANSVKKLIIESSYRNALIEEGLKTAEQFCHRREGRETLEYFEEILGVNKPKATAQMIGDQV